MAAKFAVSLMALLGAVSAQTGYTNSSSIATPSSTSAGSSPSASTTSVAGVTYLVQTDTSYQGTVLTLSRRRQADSSIQNCLNTCSADVSCAGTAYVSDTGSCTYYSAVDQDTKADTPGTDFALVQHRDGASSSANSTTSATGTHSATRPGVSGSSNSTGSATRSSSRPAGITGAGNSTSSRPTGSASRTSSATAVPSTPSTLLTFDGVLFLLEIDFEYSGITIDFAIILAKRASNSLDDCLATCAGNSQCAGTSFTDGTCTFYSSITQGSGQPAQGTDFATVVSRAGQIGAGNGNNGTSGGNTTAPSTPSNATAESFICPAFNAAILKSNTQVTFSISCSSFLIGTTFDLEASILSKRQTFDNGLPQTLSNCVDLCSLSTQCVGATFEDATGQCTYYSAVQYSTVLAGFDSAVRVQSNGNGGEPVTTTLIVDGQTQTVTVPAGTTTQYVAGATSTATVYSTVTSVVTANGAGATALPVGATVTQVVSLTTTTYVNSVPTITIPSNQNVVTITVGGSGNAAPTVTESVTVTVDGNGNVIGSSTADAVAGAGGIGSNSYPTVTVHDLYCPTSTAANVVFTTVYVR
ncbi:hypothetical protein E4T50_01816 [Aureobasidium sp. EXF-12298]|nr:hypothetical protein E4T50_01816 [Aureobasidium sp. EXF-12298]KAI4760470.1 hypothetical protein E4T51_06550 [Aureobasidium sp. EXF-12344]KAI4784141.1 hypothetical protein E4T52_00963 [Aureobasidium sp. EXF-3400]